ncbi:MAG: SDR family oxidoreductase [Gemmatimonadota bacterium]|nr:SDR family oxidoreductase [Gemmatimonadota bacterium]
MLLEDAVALVTGAGHRLGRAIALGLARAGADVVVHYGRSREAAEGTADDIRRLGREALTLPADLREPDEIAELFRQTRDRLPRLDILVNSAATFARAPFDEIPVDDWDASLEVNVRAPFLCTRLAARLMRDTAADRVDADGRPAAGSVVNIGDMSGIVAWRGYVQHGVSKAALLHFTRLSARELAPGVRVNAVVPGPILPPAGEELSGEAWRRKGERVPLGRVGDPSHVAASVVYLCENDYVTGDTLFVDGGEHLLAGGGRDGG